MASRARADKRAEEKVRSADINIIYRVLILGRPIIDSQNVLFFSFQSRSASDQESVTRGDLQATIDFGNLVGARSSRIKDGFTSIRPCPHTHDSRSGSGDCSFSLVPLLLCDRVTLPIAMPTKHNQST